VPGEEVLHSHTLLLAPQVVLKEKSKLFLWSKRSSILKEQNGEQCWISVSGLCCLGQLQLPWGHPRSWKQVPPVGGNHEMEMETRFAACPRSGVTCIAPALEDVPEAM